MNNTPEFFGLRSPDGREAQLLSVQVHGELLGLMLRLTVRQTWRNVSGAPMAARFSFPQTWNQCLLSLQALRNGETLTPGRIERDSRQRCSTALGILHTGEQVTMVWQIGQLMQLQGGSLRVQLPAALAPRTPYPLKLDFEIHDPVAQGTVSSPSHELHRVRHAKGTTLTLRPQRALDKDLVLTVHGLRDMGFAVASPSPVEPGTCTVLVSSHTRLRQGASDQSPLRMKLLVESSSAMPAERLGQIHTALDRLLARLTPDDQLSFTRFGEQAVHDLPRMQVCTEAYQRRVRALARHTDTDLGAPQVEAALQATLEIPDEDEEAVSAAAILLVTASPLWAIDAPLRSLRATQHTLHVLTVGHEAAHSFWQELAEASGGACEALAPGQHVEPHLARLIEQIRAQFPVQTDLRIQGAEVLDLTERPTRLCDGDTLHLWAQVRPLNEHRDLVGCPELQATLQWQRDDLRSPPVALTPLPVLWDETGDLARLCAARDARHRQDDAARQALLDKHRLLWPDASRLMAQAPAAKPAAPVSPLPMRPKVLPRAHVAAATAPTARPAVLAAAPGNSPVTPFARPSRPQPPRQASLATWLENKAASGNPLPALIQGFNVHAETHGHFRAALSATLHQVPTRFLDGLVLQLSRQAGSPGRVWALLLFWLHAEHDMPLRAQALSLVEQELAHMSVTLRTEAHTALAAAASPLTTRHAA